MLVDEVEEGGSSEAEEVLCVASGVFADGPPAEEGEGVLG